MSLDWSATVVLSASGDELRSAVWRRSSTEKIAVVEEKLGLLYSLYTETNTEMLSSYLPCMSRLTALRILEIHAEALRLTSSTDRGHGLSFEGVRGCVPFHSDGC